MIDELEAIAGEIGAGFCFGTLSDLNIFADHHAEGLLLFHEGFHVADVARLKSGAIQYSYPLSLVLLTPGALADAPSETRANLALLRPIVTNLFAILSKRYGVASARESGNLLVKRTDRVLDGIRLSLTVTTDLQPLC